MKITTFINKNGMVSYTIAIVFAIILNMLGFGVINQAFSNLLKVLYFIILICAILSFYKSKKKNTNSLIFILLPIFLLFTAIPLKVVTMIIVCPVFLFKDITPVRRAVGILIYTVFITFGVIGILAEQSARNVIIAPQYSPNVIYRIDTVEIDQGALGGDTFITLEEIYFGIIKRDIKTLYHGHWGEKPKVTWVDNNIVNINGKDMDIHTSKTWENKN